MTTKTNGARRVYQILENAKKRGEDPKFPLVLAMWGKVLTMPLLMLDPGAPDFEDTVLPFLSDFRRQIRLIESVTRTQPDYESLVAPLIRGAIQMSGTNILHASWKDMKERYLKDELVSGWGLLARSIADTDQELTSDQLQELWEAIADLERTVLTGKTPEPLRSFLMRHVASMRAALVKLHIIGTEDLRAALAAGFGEFVREQSTFSDVAENDPQTRTVLEKLFRVWKGTAEFCGDLEKYKKAVDLGVKLVVGADLAHQAHTYLPVLHQLLLGGPK